MIALWLCGVFATIAVLVLLTMDWIPMRERLYAVLDRATDVLIWLTLMAFAVGLIAVVL